MNKIISDATINLNSDAAGRLAELNRYVQDNLATFKGIADGSIDALNEDAKQRIDQLSNNAANLVLALPIPAQPLPNVPGNGYSLVRVDRRQAHRHPSLLLAQACCGAENTREPSYLLVTAGLTFISLVTMAQKFPLAQLQWD